MSTISKTETPTGQEEAAILLEEYERRIATLQESLKQALHVHPNEAVILQEIKRVVEERDDLERRLQNAELLIERLKAREIKLKQFESSERCANKLWREAHEGKDFWPGKTGLLMWLMDEVDRFHGQIDNTTDKQPEGMTKLDKALQNIAIAKRVLVENSCPSEFGLKDCECDDSCCEDCWNEEVTE